MNNNIPFLNKKIFDLELSINQSQQRLIDLKTQRDIAMLIEKRNTIINNNKRKHSITTKELILKSLTHGEKSYKELSDILGRKIDTIGENVIKLKDENKVVVFKRKVIGLNRDIIIVKLNKDNNEK